MADQFDPDAFMASRQAGFDPDAFMATRGNTAVAQQKRSILERARANLPSSLANLYGMGQMNQPAQSEPEFLPYQPTRKQNQSMGGPPAPTRNPKAPVNVPGGLAIPPITTPWQGVKDIVNAVANPGETFANDPAGTLAAMGGVGRVVYEGATHPTIVSGARAAAPDLAAGAAKATAGAAVGTIAGFGANEYGLHGGVIAGALGGGSAVPGVLQMGRGLKAGWQAMRGATPREPAPLPKSVNLSRYAEPESPTTPQPRAVRFPNEPIPETPQPRTVSFPDVGPPDGGRSGGALPKSVKFPVTSATPTPQAASGTVPLLDQIARGTGGRAFDRLSPSEQQAVRTIAERVQSTPEALPPKPEISSVQQVESPPAPQTTPESLPPEVKIPQEGSREWHAQEAQRLYLERAKAKDLVIKDYLESKGMSADEWMALTPAERAAQLKPLGFKLGRDRRPEFARGGIIGLPPKVNITGYERGGILGTNGKSPVYMAPGPTAGLVRPGNIDLVKLPIINNPDGSWSTVNSASFQDEKPNSPTYGKEVLVRGIINGKKLEFSPQSEKADGEAIRNQYYVDGKHLGIFDNGAAADAYGLRLHSDWESGRIPGVQLREPASPSKRNDSIGAQETGALPRYAPRFARGGVIGLPPKVSLQCGR